MNSLMAYASATVLTACSISIPGVSADYINTECSITSQGIACSGYSKIQAGMKKIESFSSLEEDWNGYGAPAFSDHVIENAQNVLLNMSALPEIFPTGRGSIQMEYTLADGTYIEFEIFDNDTAAILYIPHGDVSQAEEKSVSIHSISEFTYYNVLIKGL